MSRRRWGRSAIWALSSGSACWVLCWVLCVPAAAEDRLALGHSRAEAGSSLVPLEATVTNDEPIHGFSLALRFDPSVLLLREITDEGTVTRTLGAEFFQPSIASDLGIAVLGVIFPFRDDPFEKIELPASPAAPQRVAILRFDVAAGAPPGDHAVELVDGLGSPPISNVFTREGRTKHPLLSSGRVTVNNQNLLVLDRAAAPPGGSAWVNASARHDRPLQGFSIAFTFDDEAVEVVESTYAGTDAAGALAPHDMEYFFLQVDRGFAPRRARASLGVVLDFQMPFEGQEIPASPLELRSLARFLVEVKFDPTLIGTETVLTLHNGGLGLIDNIFVIGQESVSPDLENGRIAVVPLPDFRRGLINDDEAMDLSDPVFLLNFLFLGGEPPSCLNALDANDDGTADLSDGIFIFSYLFLGGAPPASPHLECGQDPTPSGLPCGSFPRCG